MGARLPLALRKIHFEPLDATSDGPSHPRIRHETADFTDRVEKLANDYLRGRPLFIHTASLRGPFDDAWAEFNPWAPKHPRSHKSPSQHPRLSSRNYAPKSKTEHGGGLPSRSDVNTCELMVDGEEDADNKRSYKRRRTTKDDDTRSPLNRSSTEIVMDSMYMNDDGVVKVTAQNCPSRISPSLEGAAQAEMHPPSIVGEENVTDRERSKTEAISASTGSATERLRGSLPTPSDSGRATPRLEAGGLPTRGYRRDALAESTKHLNRKQSMSQPSPETTTLDLIVNEKEMPSTLPALDYVKANEKRHNKTMQKIFPRPIKELEQSVADWAIHVGEQFKNARDNQSKPDLPANDRDSPSRHLQATHKQHSNAGSKRKRFMTFDTPPVPLLKPATKGKPVIEAVNLRESTARSNDAPALADPESRSAVDLTEAIDCHTNTVMSPAEAVRMRRVARLSAAAWSTFSGDADSDTSNAATKFSPYICTQAAMEQAHEAFQEGLLSPVKEAPPQTPQGATEEVQITPFSRFATPPVDEIHVQEEEPVISTQDLFDRAPVFSATSARRTTFALQNSTDEDNVKESAVDISSSEHGSGILKASNILGTSSCANPRSILKGGKTQAAQGQPDESPGIDVDSFLEEATLFLEPFNLDAELNKTRQGNLVLSQ